MSSQTTPTDKQLALLAEVCCELGQTALKLSRSSEYDDIPVSCSVSEEYIQSLIDRIIGARNIFDGLLHARIKRWAQRLGQRKDETN